MIGYNLRTGGAAPSNDVACFNDRQSRAQVTPSGVQKNQARLIAGWIQEGVNKRVLELEKLEDSGAYAEKIKGLKQVGVVANQIMEREVSLPGSSQSTLPLLRSSSLSALNELLNALTGTELTELYAHRVGLQEVKGKDPHQFSQRMMDMLHPDGPRSIDIVEGRKVDGLAHPPYDINETLRGFSMRTAEALKGLESEAEERFSEEGWLTALSASAHASTGKKESPLYNATRVAVRNAFPKPVVDKVNVGKDGATSLNDMQEIFTSFISGFPPRKNHLDQLHPFIKDKMEGSLSKLTPLPVCIDGTGRLRSNDKKILREKFKSQIEDYKSVYNTLFDELCGVSDTVLSPKHKEGVETLRGLIMGGLYKLGSPEVFSGIEKVIDKVVRQEMDPSTYRELFPALAEVTAFIKKSQQQPDAGEPSPEPSAPPLSAFRASTSQGSEPTPAELAQLNLIKSRLKKNIGKSEFVADNRFKELLETLNKVTDLTVIKNVARSIKTAIAVSPNADVVYDMCIRIASYFGNGEFQEYATNQCKNRIDIIAASLQTEFEFDDFQGFVELIKSENDPQNIRNLLNYLSEQAMPIDQDAADTFFDKLANIELNAEETDIEELRDAGTNSVASLSSRRSFQMI